MDRISWIEYKGKKILYVNIQGVASQDENFKLLQEEVRAIAEATEPILLLLNLEDAYMTAEGSAYSKEQLAKYSSKIIKTALVGITGIKTIIAKGIESAAHIANQRLFDTVDEAKEWLVA